MCWTYNPRARKGLLPFNRYYSKLVKIGTASTCLHSAITKSCQHRLSNSFDLQVEQLHLAGYPYYQVSKVCKKLSRQPKSPSGKNLIKQRVGMRVEGVPYVHRVSHNLRKVAAWHKFNVAFSNSYKLYKIYSTLSRKKVCPVFQET